jgi:hypothetical protein
MLMMSVCIVLLVLAGRGGKGDGYAGVAGEPFQNGAVDSLGKRSAKVGVHTRRRSAIPSKGTFLAKINHKTVCNIIISVSSIKRKYSFCVG